MKTLSFLFFLFQILFVLISKHFHTRLLQSVNRKKSVPTERDKKEGFVIFKFSILMFIFFFSSQAVLLELKRAKYLTNNIYWYKTTILDSNLLGLVVSCNTYKIAKENGLFFSPDF